MPWYQKKITSGGLIEDEIYYSRRTCGKKIPRCKNENATDEEQNKRNYINSMRTMLRKFHANFGSDDIFATLDFAKEPKSYEEAMRILKNFLQRVRRWLKNHGLPTLKYIAVVEDDETRLHIHIVMTGMSMDGITKLWTCGFAQLEHLNVEKHYSELTNYMSK
ncbi:MAG: hypothetical protein RSA23_09635, partial [Carnobacterium sp.]